MYRTISTTVNDKRLSETAVVARTFIGLEDAATITQ